MFNRIKAIMTSLSMSSAGESDEKVQINTKSLWIKISGNIFLT